jgi:hypothetical protein
VPGARRTRWQLPEPAKTRSRSGSAMACRQAAPKRGDTTPPAESWRRQRTGRTACPARRAPDARL